MVNAEVLLDEYGPLPVSANFQAPADGSVMFVLSGTAWTQRAPTLTEVNLLLDGQSIGSAMCYANQNASHQALRITFIIFPNLTQGNHLLQIVPANGGTVTDVNDYFQVTILY